MIVVHINYFGESDTRAFDSFECAKAFIDSCSKSTIAYFCYNGRTYSNQ